MADNIAEPTVTDVTDLMEQMEEKAEKPAETPRVQPIFFDLLQARDMIGQKYKRTFENLTFRCPPQLTDGCGVEFYDEDVGVAVASAKLRFRSKLLFGGNGEMQLEVLLSDLAFGGTRVMLK